MNNERIELLLSDAWKKLFDHIYCVSFLPYKERREQLDKELERIGILNSGIFSYHYTFQTPIDDVLLKCREFNCTAPGLRFNRSALNLAIGHYSIMKEALGLGYKRVLIIEDDISFLQDKEQLLDRLNEFAETKLSDIVLFDYVGINAQSSVVERILMKHSLKKSTLVPFGSNSIVLWNASCYSVNEAAMKKIISKQESKFTAADYYTNQFSSWGEVCHPDPDDYLTRSFSRSRLAMQKPSQTTVSDHGKDNWVYTQNGLYMVNSDKPEDYGIN